MVYTATCNSPVGKLLLAEQDGALAGLWIGGQKYFLGSLRDEMEEKPESALLRQKANWLDRYFSGEKPAISELKLAPAGSAFRREVWRILCEIPYGEITTYGKIAEKLAKNRGLPRMSAQAVGVAVGHNPISIIIPCHRVISANGSLTGYAGGIEKKLQLLTHEGVNTDKLFVPKKGTAL